MIMRTGWWPRKLEQFILLEVKWVEVFSISVNFHWAEPGAVVGPVCGWDSVSFLEATFSSLSYILSIPFSAQMMTEK